VRDKRFSSNRQKKQKRGGLKEETVRENGLNRRREIRGNRLMNKREA